MDGVLLVIGAPGAGKTSLLEALANELERERVPFGALESEQLAWGYPLLPAAVWSAELEAVLACQRDAGRRLFLVAATPESQADLALLIAACGTEELLTVCVTAGRQTVVTRLSEREDDDWVGKEELIVRARRLAEVVPALEGIDVRLDSEREGPRELAGILYASLADGLLTGASRGL